MYIYKITHTIIFPRISVNIKHIRIKKKPCKKGLLALISITKSAEISLKFNLMTLLS